jgi:hypothetical protein
LRQTRDIGIGNRRSPAEGIARTRYAQYVLDDLIVRPSGSFGQQERNVLLPLITVQRYVGPQE